MAKIAQKCPICKSKRRIVWPLSSVCVCLNDCGKPNCCGIGSRNRKKQERGK